MPPELALNFRIVPLNGAVLTMAAKRSKTTSEMGVKAAIPQPCSAHGRGGCTTKRKKVGLPHTVGITCCICAVKTRSV